MKDFNEYFKLRDEDEENIAQAGYVERFSKIEYAQIERHNRLCNNGFKNLEFRIYNLEFRITSSYKLRGLDQRIFFFFLHEWRGFIP
ncbi:hypothetical protein [Okeania sp. KiyG1]|uniref:hypothetical protein n=1 Tax=Okeania sp. KiyG1 TaxID=2720165 RepID=UPI001922A874|nr:hypothetical protein [Okeania sp. KiyG1]GGA21713.1 hypothetical protein CYANOKiyG1_36710 [Okeania sp. KiyG1]